MKKLRVTVEGKTYHVLVETLDEGAPTAASHAPLPATVTAPAAAPAQNGVAPSAPTPVAVAPRPASAAAGPGAVRSPLAGKVVSVDVQSGQTIAEGAQLLTIEAMKMNTYIYAPKSGRVENLLVNAGDAVDEGQPLLDIS